MLGASNIFFGLLAIVLSLLGLILGAGAEDDAMYIFGLSLFVGGALFVYWLIKKSFDAEEAARH
ncbi:MAG: hypothetical protein IT557_02035 [Alphaproteobacteria bacterium]|nr:hypothetical protein [Alphaproteobacteria bacterium]